MIQNKDNTQGNQNFKQPFRYRGPLDAYIYEKRGDQEDVEQCQDQMLVHLPAEQQILHIFTDGACSNNGKRGAAAAWGVILLTDIGHSIIDTDSGRIPPNEPQTNQRAELRALLRGLEIAENYLLANKGVKEIQLWSDSQYAIKCTSEWGPTWRKNGWTKRGGDIQHLDLVKPLVETYARLYSKLRLKWIEGHKGGAAANVFPWCFNHQVDRLATGALGKRDL